MKPLGPSQHSIVLRELKKALNLAPTMPRAVILVGVLFSARAARIITSILFTTRLFDKVSGLSCYGFFFLIYIFFVSKSSCLETY